MGRFRYLAPRSLKELLAVKQEKGAEALLLAGGTNLLVYIKEGTIKEGTLVDINSLKELKGIECADGEIAIGAVETIADLLYSPLLNERIPFFTGALKEFANPLVRNSATIGGNLADASPIGDTIPPLLVLEADVLAANAGGERSIPLEKLFLNPGETSLGAEEVIREVRFRVPERGRGAHIKLGLRKGTSCSVTSVALWLEAEANRVRDIRIACGGVAPTPLRARKTEEAFRGQSLDWDRIEMMSGKLADDINPITDVRGSAEYRRQVTVRLLARAVRQALGMEE